ncbi:MAG: Ig-like domain-containing protein, partial [Prevotellaceae bacterium]|nr:Ig-like domain-containing protein [Prevotellaceae bacterium]
MKRILTLILLLTTMTTMSAATEWIDLTSEYINNPDFAESSNVGWTMSASASSTSCSYEAQEFWDGTWNFYQKVSLANGHYRLSVNGYYRPGYFSSSDAGNYESIAITSMLYANETNIPLKSVYSESLTSNYRSGCWGYTAGGFGTATKWYPNNMEAGAYCFSQGMYENELEFDVTDGSLIFGIINETYVAGNWTMIDNWKLEYYGTMTYVSSITLDQTEKNLVVGEKFQLTATVQPTDATIPSLSWSSDNTNVATVDNEGNVTGVAIGSATITASATDGSGVEATCTITVNDGSANLQDIIITEIQSANIDQFIDPSWNYGGWVELYNPGDTGVPIQGCWVSDDPQNLQMVHISQPMAVPAKGYLNLWFGHHDKYCPSQIDMQLDEEGGTIYISDSNGKLITSQTYPEAISRCSYARKSLTGDEWAWTSTPTPEQANDGSTYCTERLDAPVVDKDSQIFGTTLTVCVNIPEGATLKYTIDGSAPTATNGETSATGLFYPSATTCYRFCLCLSCTS